MQTVIDFLVITLSITLGVSAAGRYLLSAWFAYDAQKLHVTRNQQERVRGHFRDIARILTDRLPRLEPKDPLPHPYHEPFEPTDEDLKRFNERTDRAIADFEASKKK